MDNDNKSSKQNIKSYLFTMFFILPTFGVSNAVARSDEIIADFAKVVSLLLMVFIVIWTSQRLRNAGNSPWWTFALIPPATIFLLIYNFVAPSSKDHTNRKLYMYGIRAKGFWRIVAIIAISLFLAYLSLLFVTFLTDGL